MNYFSTYEPLSQFFIGSTKLFRLHSTKLKVSLCYTGKKLQIMRVKVVLCYINKWQLFLHYVVYVTAFGSLEKLTKTLNFVLLVDLLAPP